MNLVKLCSTQKLCHCFLLKGKTEVFADVATSKASAISIFDKFVEKGPGLSLTFHIKAYPSQKECVYCPLLGLAEGVG